MNIDDKDMLRAQDLAHSIAMSELLRLILGELAFNADAQIFRQRLKAIEEAAVTSLGSRRHYPDTNGYTETVIKEAACGYVTRLIASIRHPSDPEA